MYYLRIQLKHKNEEVGHSIYSKITYKPLFSFPMSKRERAAVSAPLLSILTTPRNQEKLIPKTEQKQRVLKKKEWTQKIPSPAVAGKIQTIQKKKTK